MAPDGPRILATYRLAPTDEGRRPGSARAEPAPDREATLARARALARESTLELVEGVAPDRIEARLLGRVESLEPWPEEDEGGPGGEGRGRGARGPNSGTAWRLVLSHAPEILDGGLPQLLNLVHGNLSLLPGVRLVELELPRAVLGDFPGPRHGMAGIREMLGAGRRPVVGAVIKPVGLSVEELARQAATFARAGVDLVKDDHSLADQTSAPFRERARAVAEAVARANEETGGRTAYFANVTGPAEEMARRAAWAAEVGCGGVLVCPSLVGLDAVRALAADPGGLPIMSHPSGADVGPERETGMAPEVLFGLLYRLIGADAVVYVNAGGRFAWSVETCQAVNARLRGPLGRLRPAFPVPAGGVEAEEASRWFRIYGPDTMLLFGGSLLKAADVEEATRRLMERAREAEEA